MNPDKRTDEELNRIIAEWCGWEWNEVHQVFEKPTNDYTIARKTPPNYSGDLNACHEAEGKLDADSSGFNSWTYYANTLCQITGSHRACIHATARQRAEALVRVIEQQKGNQ